MNIDKDYAYEGFDDETESEFKSDVKKFSEAVVWGTDWTTETIARQLEKENINLNPSFQRRDAWTDVEKCKLIESLILGIPVPPIILAENKNKKNSYIVIDGKQRLLSIRRFYSNISEKEYKEKNLSNSNSFKQLKLKNLEILTELNDLTYEDIKMKFDEYATNIDNQAIRTIVIKNWPDEAFLYTVFLRLNTGSKKLSPQELRQALKPGEFLNYLDEATAESKTIMKMLNNDGPDPRMKDIELALRFYAFKYKIESYSGNLKDFLDETCGYLNSNWEKEKNTIKEMFYELENSINFSYEIMGKNPFSRYTNSACHNRFNRSIFEIFSYYFSVPNIRAMVEKEKDDFVKKFIELNDDKEFTETVSGTTKDLTKVVTRYNKFLNLLLEIAHSNKITFDKLIIRDNKIKIEKVSS